MHPTIRTKLLGLSAILLAMMMVLGVLAIAMFGSNGDAVRRLTQDEQVTERAIARMGSDFFQLDGGLNMYLLVAPGSGAQKDAWATYQSGLADFEAQHDALAARTLSPGLAADLSKAKTSFTTYLGFEKDMEAALARGDQAAAVKAMTVDNNDASNALQKELTDMSTAASDATAATADATLGQIDTSRLITILVIVIAVIVGFALAWWLARRIVGGVTAVQDTLATLADKCATSLAEGMERLRDNDLTYDVQPATPLIERYGTDEIGKGFAVVADEVRKLAERSGRATKEIASLIAEVQKGTSDAVNAMSAGAREVEQGLVVGQKGAQSAAEIREATHLRDRGAATLYGAVDDIAAAAHDVTSSSDDIARVVAQTAAGASTMAAASDSVTRSIGSIAAVSEENSAAAEEVSAATEEMSAQAEEVVASASTLADMASQLDVLVARFVLENQDRRTKANRVGKGDNVVQRRRSADWAKAS